MKLYHGTSEAAARLITQGSLAPRVELDGLPEDGNWQHTVPSNPEAVYLTDAYAPYFAGVAARQVEGDEHEGPPTQRHAIIEVETGLLRQSYFHPDEDFLEQVSRKDGASPEPLYEDVGKDADMKARTLWYRDNIFAFQNYWEDSLKGLGTCCYYDAIPLTAITRITLVDTTRCPDMALMAMDPLISVMNYQILAGKYRALTRWFAGYRVEPHEFHSMLGADGRPIFEQLPVAQRTTWSALVADQSMIETIHKTEQETQHEETTD